MNKIAQGWFCTHDHVSPEVFASDGVFQWTWKCDDCGQPFAPLKVVLAANAADPKAVAK